MRAVRRDLPVPLPDVGVGLSGIVGMFDVVDPSAGRSDMLRLIQNAYVPPGPPGTPVTGIPGFQVAGARLGTGATRAGQLVYQFTTSNGVTRTIAIVGGQFYQFTWATRTWTEVLTAAHFATATITVNASAPCYAVTLGNAMIVTDGINTPWMWNGTAGGGLTKLTNAPVFYGQPWVYYAKVFAIKAAERNAFVWSEENNPTTGYEAGGFNNAWSPLGSVPFYAGCGTNESMYVGSARRVIRISGAVLDDFRTSGTRSDVSESIGAVAPMLVTDIGVFFVDADARPYWIAYGMPEPTPIWQQARETVGALTQTALDRARLFYDPVKQVVWFALANAGESSPSFWLGYSTRTGTPTLTGLVRGFRQETVGMVLNADQVPVPMHLGTADGSDAGYAYDHGTPDRGPWNFGFAAGPLAIDHQVTTHPMATDVKGDKAFTRADLLLTANTSATLHVVPSTPRGVFPAFTVTAAATVGVPLGSFILDVDQLAGVTAEQRVAAGLGDVEGRWLVLELEHGALDEQFGFVGAAVEAIATRDTWEVP